MKITKDTLKQLIKEELAIVLAEQDGGFRPQPKEMPGGGIDREPSKDESELAAFKALGHLDRRGGSLILDIARRALMRLDQLADRIEEATSDTGPGHRLAGKHTDLGAGSKTPFKLADMSALEECVAVIDTARAKIRELVKRVEDVTPRSRFYSK